MTALAHPVTAPGHPAAVIAGVHAALDALREVELHDEDYADLVAECARARSRLQAVELGLVAAAERAKVPQRAGARSAGSWLASKTRSGQAQAARDARLASDLDSRLPATAAALSSGEVSTEHASVIASATSKLPPGLTGEQRETVEHHLVDQARALDPDQLRRAARRALEAVERDRAAVDAHEDAALRDEEAAALGKSRLTLHDNGDGTVSGHFTVPTLAAQGGRRDVVAPARASWGDQRSGG
jgi:hypothetical protein